MKKLSVFILAALVSSPALAQSQEGQLSLKEQVTVLSESVDIQKAALNNLEASLHKTELNKKTAGPLSIAGGIFMAALPQAIKLIKGSVTPGATPVVTGVGILLVAEGIFTIEVSRAQIPELKNQVEVAKGLLAIKEKRLQALKQMAANQ